MKKLSSVLIFFLFLNPLDIWQTLGQVSSHAQAQFQRLIDQRKFNAAEVFVDSLIAESQNGSIDQANAVLLKAIALQSQKKLTDAHHLADSLLRTGVFDEIPALQMQSFLVLGNVNYSRFRQKEATALYLKIDSLGDKYQDGIETQIKALTNLGTLMLSVEEGRAEDFLRSGDYYYSKALALSLHTNDSTSFYDLSTYLATQDFGKGKLDSIENVYLQAIAFFEKTKNQKLLASTLWGLGWAYESENEPDKAEDTYQRLIRLNSGDSAKVNDMARAHWIYANFLNRREDIDGAIREFETAEKLFNSEKEQDIGPLNGTIYNLATLYRKAGRDREAFDYLEKAWTMQDSIDQAMEYDLLKELEIKYQTAQKDKAIAELQLETSRRNFQIGIGLAAFTLLVAGFIFFVRYQRKKIALAKKITDLDEVKNQFFENITHEFRTPLTLIDSPLQLLSKDNQTTPEAKTKIELIRSQSSRLLELVDQILSLNQLKNGEINVLLKKSNLNHSIRSILDPFEFQAKEKGIQWQSALKLSEEEVWFDFDLLQKILGNLLGNALKYTPSEGKIILSGSHDGKFLKLKIQNSAPDIHPQDLKKIFDRFYQKDDKSSGFGIGLSLVKAVLDRLNGSWEAAIQDQSLVISAQIPVTLDLLPQNAIVLQETPEPEAAAADPTEALGEKPILLIAEDHPDTRAILSDIFRKDYQVITAKTGVEAWKICQEVVPDLILSDISMPDVGGLELCRKIKVHEFLSHIPVFLLTASSGIASQIKGAEAEADGYMTKPFNHDLLISEIKKLITQRKKLRDRYSREVILKPVDLAINSAEEQFLEKLQQVIADNFENPDFSAENFASAMAMSRMQLHRKLKHLTGLSAMEFLKDQRLKTAANLLSRGDLSVSDVAYSVGFNDISHFSKSFKASFGQSPTDYQQSN
ncbi:hybrid sensor histidine kinase/response regulator transcription factor [Algoriphagus boritolerans]|uniref:histidine kinase n=1 Tax=Algoriphagus boritolerans DSM 17298 = JCM 18970 TaxID=1120964 RepID=A0A1H5T555_9BACT|nr:response regulator [Algoriphagus boritolerans]SEF57930.1 Signal transduction histidine kinase [Algoriphagus boritolerans DSM 17298 = JCM 18970]